MSDIHLHLSDTFRIQVENGPSPILTEIKNQLATIMSTLTDLQTAVSQEDSVIASAVALLQGLSDKIAALTPDQASIDALAADVRTQSDALAAAVNANTPAA